MCPESHVERAMPELPLACWNCKKPMGTMDDASPPVAVKLGVTAVMFLLGQWMMYPSHVCKRCRTFTGVIGILGLTGVGALVGYGIYAWVSHR